MSQIMHVDRKCSVCGTENHYVELRSTNSLGAPDLDLRPPEMKRSTMPLWVQKCSQCGYVSFSIEDTTKVNEEFLNSEEYCSCSNIDFKSDLARKFYKFYLINIFDNNCVVGFYAALYAAWSCDDEKDEENAVLCRKLTIAEIEKIFKNYYEHLEVNGRETLLVQKADLLRRAGMFEELINEYSDLEFTDAELQKIIDFQIEKAKMRDTACYTVDDVKK